MARLDMAAVRSWRQSWSMELLRFEKLTVYQKSVQLVDDMIGIREHAPSGTSEVAKQGERASWSVTLNIAEACGEFSRREKLKFLRYALRSTTEVIGACTILGRYAGPHRERCALTADRAREIVKMLTRMIVGPGQSRSPRGAPGAARAAESAGKTGAAGTEKPPGSVRRGGLPQNG